MPRYDFRNVRLSFHGVEFRGVRSIEFDGDVLIHSPPFPGDGAKPDAEIWAEARRKRLAFTRGR